ncbi:MAG: hypothetical protein V1855_02815 [bacterium]
MNFRYFLFPTVFFCLLSSFVCGTEKYILEFDEKFFERDNKVSILVTVGLPDADIDPLEALVHLNEKKRELDLSKVMSENLGKQIILSVQLDQIFERFCLTKKSSSKIFRDFSIFKSRLKYPGTYKVSLFKKDNGLPFLFLRRIKDGNGNNVEGYTITEGYSTVVLPCKEDKEKDKKISYEPNEEQEVGYEEDDDQEIEALLRGDDEDIIDEERLERELNEMIEDDDHTMNLRRQEISGNVGVEHDQYMQDQNNNEFGTPPRDPIRVIPNAPRFNRQMNGTNNIQGRNLMDDFDNLEE